jgi:hypothetical protein
MIMTETDPYESLWQSRPEDLLAALKPILDWTDETGRRCTSKAIAAIVTLHGLGAIVDRQLLPVQPDGQPRETDLPLAPDLARRLRRYLCDIAGFDPARPCSEQLPVVSKHHGYALLAARDRLRALVADRDGPA